MDLRPQFCSAEPKTLRISNDLRVDLIGADSPVENSQETENGDCSKL